MRSGPSGQLISASIETPTRATRARILTIEPADVATKFWNLYRDRNETTTQAG